MSLSVLDVVKTTKDILVHRTNHKQLALDAAATITLHTWDALKLRKPKHLEHGLGVIHKETRKHQGNKREVTERTIRRKA